VIALSSGEAEYYGLVTGSSEGLGDQSIAMDWGIKLDLNLWMDATAGAAIGSRRGLGKVKHIHTAYLWVQDLVSRGLAKIHKCSTVDNLADLLTKAVSAGTLQRLMHHMHFSFTEGRAKLGLGL
jgi:hypothetical protein